MIKNIGVYQIELNGKKYVGSTAKSFKIRWQLHLNHLRKGVHRNRHLQSAYNKYGENKICFSILEIVETPEEVIVIEQKYLDELKPEYNINPVAGSRLGSICTDVSKGKMAESQKGKKHSEETKQNMSKARLGNIYALGYKHSKETKQKISEIKKGNKYSAGYKHTEETLKKMRGRSLPEETKRKMSESHMGHKFSTETRGKLSQINKGKNLSEKTKLKLRNINLGKIMSEETKRKISMSEKGKIVSSETIKKQSDSMKEWWKNVRIRREQKIDIK